MIFIDNTSQLVMPACTAPAPPTPPEPVTNITLVDFTIPDHRHVHLVVQWSPPVPNGRLMYYQLWIGRRMLGAQEDVDVGQQVVNKNIVGRWH